MSTAEPPSDGGSPAEGESAAKRPSTAAKAAGAKPTTAKPVAAKPTAAKTTAAKTAAPRPRRTAAKPAPIAPEGEAPDIMDATLSAREPLAQSTAVSSSNASGDTGVTKRLPTAEELYAGAAPESPDATSDRARSVTEPAAATSDTTGETTVDTTNADETDGSTTATVPIAATDETGAAAGAGTAAAPGVSDPDLAAGAVAGGTAAESPGPHQVPYGRTVTDLADRLDDSRFFSSLFDFTFTNYVTRKLAGPVYVVGLVLIALGVIVGFANALTSAIATHAPIGAFVFLFGVLITLVGAMLAVLLLRVGIEVFCAIIEIAQNTRRRRPPGE